MREQIYSFGGEIGRGALGRCEVQRGKARG